MADTLQNIKLPANTWVDLYAASGIIVGTQIVVKNLSTVGVKLNAQALTPTQTDANTDETGSYSPLGSFDSSVNDSGDTGAWAYSHSLGLVSVKGF